MIETLSIRNFKVLREVDVRLRPLTLIVGPNASGKSSLLEALHCLAQDDRNRVLSCRSLIPSGAVSLRMDGSLKKGRFFYQVSEVPEENIHDGLSRAIDVTNLKLDVQKLAAPSELMKDLHLPENGEGLAGLLAGLSFELPDQWRLILERLRAVVPVVRDVRLTRATLSTNRVGVELLFDTQGGEGIRATNISDGTLLTLGLLTVLASPDPPKLVLIDDLERGLHPRALGELIQLLRKVQEQDPELQIVATSHSPYLLDHLQAEEILLTALDEDGYAVVRSLAEHPDYERWKDVMAPGEFWSTVGESWVTAAKK